MPSNWLYMDTNFPTFTGQESNTEKIVTIQNYLFMLVEQLRYSLHNLDGKNFNAAGLDRIGKTITEPVYLQLNDNEDHLLELSAEAAQLTARLGDAEGNMTQLKADAEGLAARITDAEGDISTLVATATSLSLVLGDVQGNITQLNLKAGELTTAVSDAQGNITALQEKVGSLRLSVSNGASSSTLTLTANGASLSSATISFSGVVTFTDLSTANGYTTVNGGNITTGVIKAIQLEGNEIMGGTVTGATLQSVGGTDNGLEVYYRLVSPLMLVGGIRFDDQGRGTTAESKYRMFIYTNSGYMDWAMKLQSAGGMSLESNGMIYMSAETEITLWAAGSVFVKGWEFRDDGIYRNDKKIVSA